MAGRGRLSRARRFEMRIWKLTLAATFAAVCLGSAAARADECDHQQQHGTPQPSYGYGAQPSYGYGAQPSYGYGAYGTYTTAAQPVYVPAPAPYAVRDDWRARAWERHRELERQRAHMAGRRWTWGASVPSYYRVR